MESENEMLKAVVTRGVGKFGTRAGLVGAAFEWPYLAAVE